MSTRCLSRLTIRLVALSAILGAPAVPASGAGCRPASELAEALLGAPESGTLDLRASAAIDFADGRALARIEMIHPASEPGALCLAVVGLGEDGFVTLDGRELQVPPGAGALRYLAELDLPPTIEELFAVGERPADGAWAAVPFAEAYQDLAPGPAAQQLSSSSSQGIGRAAWLEMERPGAGERATSTTPVVVRLVLPRERPVRGTARFDALATTDDVDRVVFLVDGQVVARDGIRPFAARLELHDPPRAQTVEVVAYGRDDVEIGRDSRQVNVGEGAFEIRLRDVPTPPPGRRVAVEVQVPPGRSLQKLIVLRGGEVLRETGTASVEIDLSGPGDPADFLLATATLDDGSSLEEALLLAAGSGEEVEVNLVELRAVVVDAEGQPVPDLPRESFRVRLDGRELEVERFSWADDVSLVAGLIIDTSGSMRLILHDTRRAAARFYGRTLRAGDRGFLVDFDRNPRLLQPVTEDVQSLLVRLAQLQAEGATAMYDAIMFSLVQLEEEGGRPALVVLTDGDDRDSRWGPKDTIRAARRLGVPVYLIALGALDDIPRTYAKKELRRLTEETGGRLFFVDAFEQLDAAYDRIGAELRNQYVLGVYTEHELSEKERDELQLSVEGPGLEVRLAVAAGR